MEKINTEIENIEIIMTSATFHKSGTYFNR